MRKRIAIDAIDPNPHRKLDHNPLSPEQVTKLIDSIKRTGFWDNLVVRPHPTAKGRYQLAYGHNRIEACRQAGILDADFSVRRLSNYDMLCCMVDENLTQQHVEPKTVFEIVSAGIKEAEKMLRETSNVYDFMAYFKRSRGLPTLLQENKSHRLGQDDGSSWREEEYTKAKQAIEPSGNGLGKDFLRHFLPPNSVANNSTLQTAITGVYEERWREEGDRLADESRLMLWQAKETNDQGKIDAALELEK